MTRTVPVPGWGAGVGDGVAVGFAAAGLVGVAVAVGSAGRVLGAVGVLVFVGRAVAVAVAVAVGVLVFVGRAVAVGVGVAVCVGVKVGVGSGVAVFVGVNVGVGRGTGVGSSNRKLARALVPPSRHEVSMLTSTVTVSPGEPVIVNDPVRLPSAVEPNPVTRLGGCEVTVMLLASHQPLPERAPLTDGAGPDPGLSTSVAV